MGKHKSTGEVENEDIYEDKSKPDFIHLDPFCKGKPVEEYEQHFHCPRCGSWKGDDIQMEVNK